MPNVVDFVLHFADWQKDLLVFVILKKARTEMCVVSIGGLKKRGTARHFVCLMAWWRFDVEPMKGGRAAAGFFSNNNDRSLIRHVRGPRLADRPGDDNIFLCTGTV